MNVSLVIFVICSFFYNELFIMNDWFKGRSAPISKHEIKPGKVGSQFVEPRAGGKIISPLIPCKAGSVACSANCLAM